MSTRVRVSPSVLLYGILAIAALLRLWGIGFGLPYDGITYDALTIEEIQEVHRALKLGAGEYAWVFGKGGLYYILFAEYAALFVISWLFGWVDSGRDFAVQALQDRTTIYLMGRITVALMGVATCFVVYRLARRIYDERVALGAALIGAVSYFHGIFSAVINVDIGATLAIWLSLLVYLQYETTGKVRYLAGAGAVAAVAIAFKAPAGIALPLIWVALATKSPGGLLTGHLLRNCSIVLGSLLVTLTVIAPEWITSVAGTIRSNFAGSAQSTISAMDPELHSDIKSITVRRADWQARYIEHLLADYNIVLLATAIFGSIAGALKRSRWDLILFGTVVVFIGIMSLSSRTQPERYILPIMPALWVLGSRGAMALGRYHRWLPAASLALVVAIPLFWLVRAAVEKSHLDTRILAKTWIEANVPSGSRILIDGMRYRYSQSPPLNPDRTTVRDRVERATEEGGHFGRGVTDLALSVYEEAMGATRGPKYELVSTVHGLQVKDISYYVENCFDYIVTSSMVAGRYRPGARGHRFFPQSAKFYEDLATDPRIRLAHEETAVHWQKSGPTIQVYQVANRCGSS